MLQNSIIDLVLTSLILKEKNHQPIHPYKKFGISLANLQNKNHNQNKFQEMKNTATQRSKTKSAKQNFLRNLQKSNFWPTQRNQESSKDLSLIPNQTKQVISKIVFYLCIARTFKVFVLLQYPLAQ